MPAYTHPIASKLPNVGTTIFTVMSRLAQEHNAINLSQGFPDFDCAPELRALVPKYFDGRNQYPPMAGVPALREIIAEKSAARYGTADGACRTELETQYPRLMLRMVEGWRQPSFAAELNQLVMDDRGDRQGFVPEVMEELWFLCQTHALVHGSRDAKATAPPAAAHEYPASAMLVDESLAVSARKDAWMAALEGV
jgi:hypothetical protein